MQRSFIVRNYHSQDFAAYVQLNPRFGKPDVVPGSDSLEALKKEFQRPGYEPTKDLFVAEVNRAIVGYVNVMPELGIGRVVLDYRVAREYCLKAILKELLDHALARALGIQP